MLNVILGFIQGVYVDDSYVDDVHNLDEARRLLSFFNNEYDARKDELSASDRAEIENRYNKYSEMIAILDRVQELRIKQALAKQALEKQMIHQQIKKLTQNIPMVYKNDTIPIYFSSPTTTSKPRLWDWFWTKPKPQGQTRTPQAPPQAPGQGQTTKQSFQKQQQKQPIL